METKQKGSYAEEKACTLLKKQGYNILERNFRFGHQEIDIIALDKDTLAFVEVRSREEGALVLPEESIDDYKKRHIIRVAQFYLQKKRLHDFPCRFDVIAILYQKDSVDIKKIELIRDAFQVN